LPRAIVILAAASMVAFTCPSDARDGKPGASSVPQGKPRHTIESLLAQARARRWDTLAIGERVARFGLALEGTPYRDATLEGPGPEVCRITTDGLDCVTFMELSLALGRVAGTNGAELGSASEVRDAVTFTRYRRGRLTDYTSRLHYTGEWITDNVTKGVVEDVTSSLGGEICPFHVGYMSAHPERYPALVANPLSSTRCARHRASSTRRGTRACPRVASRPSVAAQKRRSDRHRHLDRRPRLRAHGDDRARQGGAPALPPRFVEARARDLGWNVEPVRRARRRA
jgi:hypothetical protein